MLPRRDVQEWNSRTTIVGGGADCKRLTGEENFHGVPKSCEPFSLDSWGGVRVGGVQHPITSSPLVIFYSQKLQNGHPHRFGKSEVLH